MTNSVSPPGVVPNQEAEATQDPRLGAEMPGHRVSVYATRTGMATIVVNGTPIIPPGGYPASYDYGETPFWQVVLLNRQTLAVEMNKLYEFDLGRRLPNSLDSFFIIMRTLNAMVTDLGPYIGSGNFILLTATSNMDEACSPDSAMHEVFKSFGAGPLLDIWVRDPNHGDPSGAGTAVYALVGAGAPVSGCEGFGSIYPGAPPATTVTINALLLPHDGGFTLVSSEP